MPFNHSSTPQNEYEEYLKIPKEGGPPVGWSFWHGKYILMNGIFLCGKNEKPSTNAPTF